MAITYQAIASVTVGSGGASTIEFTSIPATYTDLILRTSLRGSTVADATVVFNTSGGTYTAKRFLGLGTGSAITDSSSSTPIRINVADQTANTFGSGIMYISNYAGSTIKTYSTDSASESNQAGNAVVMMSGNVWSITDAITKITLSISGPQSFVQYSTATLYGIKKN